MVLTNGALQSAHVRRSSEAGGKGPTAGARQSQWECFPAGSAVTGGRCLPHLSFLFLGGVKTCIFFFVAVAGGDEEPARFNYCSLTRRQRRFFSPCEIMRHVWEPLAAPRPCRGPWWTRRLPAHAWARWRRCRAKGLRRKMGRPQGGTEGEEFREEELQRARPKDRYCHLKNGEVTGPRSSFEAGWWSSCMPMSACEWAGKLW